MTQEDRTLASIIDQHFWITYWPSITRVSFKENKYDALHGYFQSFVDDYIPLKNEGKFRFILMEKSSALKRELETTGKLNKDYSIIVNVKDILRVELV